MLIDQVSPDEEEPVGSCIANRAATPEQEGMILPRTVRALKTGSGGGRGRGSGA